ncbi:MAG: hypothetical protein ABR511_04570 [Acidimicrobiales bacterium]
MGQLRAAAGQTPPNAALAATALKRMRLDWEAMASGERSAAQVEVVRA